MKRYIKPYVLCGLKSFQNVELNCFELRALLREKRKQNLINRNCQAFLVYQTDLGHFVSRAYIFKLDLFFSSRIQI